MTDALIWSGYGLFFDIYRVCKTVTRNVFRGRFGRPPFPHFFLFFSIFPFPSKSNPARGLGSDISSRSVVQTVRGRASTANAFYLFIAHRTRPVATNVILFLLNEIWKSKQMWLFLHSTIKYTYDFEKLFREHPKHPYSCGFECMYLWTRSSLTIWRSSDQ